jgi:hypothetical protein
VASPEWQAKLKTIIPSYGTKLNGNVAATEQELEYTSHVLQLQYVKPQAAEAAPQAELKPQAESKPVADIALCKSKTVTTLPGNEGTRAHSRSEAVTRLFLTYYRLSDSLICLPHPIFHVDVFRRIDHNRQLAVVAQQTVITQIRGHKFLLFYRPGRPSWSIPER